MSGEDRLLIEEAIIPLFFGVVVTLRSFKPMPEKFAMDPVKSEGYRKSNAIYRYLGPIVALVGVAMIANALLHFY